MRFCSQKVLEYLKNPRDSLVATMRNWNYMLNRRVVLRDCHGRIIGYGVVVDVARPSRDVLREWLSYSGFNSIDEWIAEAKRLSGRIPEFVYLIHVVPKVRES